MCCYQLGWNVPDAWGEDGNNNSICSSNTLIKTCLLWLGVHLSLLACSQKLNLHVWVVPLNFNAVCWMTTCYQTWPIRNYRHRQSLRTAWLPLGSTCTALFCLCSLSLTGHMQHSISISERDDTFRLCENEQKLQEKTKIHLLSKLHES